MDFFSNLKDKVFSGNAEDLVEASEELAAEVAADEASEVVSVALEEASSSVGAGGTVDIAAKLDAMNASHAEDLSWRTSIVDLLKLVDMDSSYGSRKILAGEVGIEGYGGSAEDNIALNKAVLVKLAASGGSLPSDLIS